MSVYAGSHILCQNSKGCHLNAVLWELCMCLNYWGDEIKENKIVGHVAHMWESGSAYRVLVGKLREKDHLEDVDIHGKIIMKWVLKK